MFICEVTGQSPLRGQFGVRQKGGPTSAIEPQYRPPRQRGILDGGLRGGGVTVWTRSVKGPRPQGGGGGGGEGGEEEEEEQGIRLIIL